MGFVPSAGAVEWREGFSLFILVLAFCKTIATAPLERRARIEAPKGVPKTESGANASRSSEILALLRTDGILSRAEIAKRLGLTDKQARTTMDKLRKEGIIRREGSSRGGRWLVE